LDTAKVDETLHEVYGVAVFGHEVWRPNTEEL